jgi:hypothetical protein
MSVLSDDLPPGSRNGFQVYVALWNNFTPVFTLWLCEAGCKNAPLGRFRIRQNEELISRKGRIKKRLLVIYGGHHWAILFHVLNIDFRSLRS